MNRRTALTRLAQVVTAAAWMPGALAQPTRQALHIYAFQEGEDPNNHTKHTLFLVGDGDSGPARYTAASFSNGTRFSLASSGSGTFSIQGEVLTLKAGKLEGTGVIKKGEYVEVGGLRFAFARTM